MIPCAASTGTCPSCKPRASGDDPLDLDVFHGSEA